jgi:hypothetical protein
MKLQSTQLRKQIIKRDSHIPNALGKIKAMQGDYPDAFKKKLLPL